MVTDLFTIWLKALPASGAGIALYGERPGARGAGLAALKALLADHFVGKLTILKAGGYASAAEIIANSLPSGKRTRSGDLGEVIASEYVDSVTTFTIPVKKLLWKSDRQMPMHGNDLIAVDASNPSQIRVLKGECKSRAVFGSAPVADAAVALDAHGGRPNPSTLAFITKRLYEAGRDDEADVFKRLQSNGAMAPKNVQHLIFALSGTDPSKHLRLVPKPTNTDIKRDCAAVVVADHQAFIAAAYDQHGQSP